MARLARLGLVLGLLLCAPAAEAAIPSGNLLLNPGAEEGTGSPDSSQIFPPPSWTVTGELTAVQYGAAGGYPDTAMSSSIGGGANFFSGGNATTSAGEQIIDVSGAAPEIDGGAVQADLSAYLGGFSSQDDNAVVVAAFRDGAGVETKTFQIGPVTAQERSNETSLLPRSNSATVPAGTRAIRVTLTANDLQGTANDGYADNISLTLRQGTALPPPTIGKTANASPATGTVRVKLPGSGGFIDLADAQQLPVGTTFDATKGTVQLSLAAGAKAQEGLFSGGQFVLQQTKKNPLTTLSMTGGGLNGCKTKLPKGGSPKGTAAAEAAAKRRRSLFSNVKGRFATRGRNSSATVRGTQWTMTDTCTGTLTSVKKGSVTVRDFRLRKNVTVTAGHRYLARSLLKKKRH